jgi:hypothetical protein
VITDPQQRCLPVTQRPDTAQDLCIHDKDSCSRAVRSQESRKLEFVVNRLC